MIFKSNNGLYATPDPIFNQHKDTPLELIKFSNYLGEAVWVAGMLFADKELSNYVADSGTSICFERLEVLKASTLQLSISDETRVEAMKNFYRSCESHYGWAIEKTCYNQLKKIAYLGVMNL